MLKSSSEVFLASLECGAFVTSLDKTIVVPLVERGAFVISLAERRQQIVQQTIAAAPLECAAFVTSLDRAVYGKSAQVSQTIAAAPHVQDDCCKPRCPSGLTFFSCFRFFYFQASVRALSAK